MVRANLGEAPDELTTLEEVERMAGRGARQRAASGGFSRSAGAAAGRGVLLIVLGLAIGVLLLGRALDDAPATEAGPASPVASVTSGAAADTTTPDEVADTTATSAQVTPLHTPEEVKVLVLNGNGVSGIARINQEALLPEGYTTLAPADGPLSPRTVVYYTDPAYEPDSRAVADLLTVPGENVEPFSTTSGIDAKDAHVVVLLGQDGLHRKVG